MAQCGAFSAAISLLSMYAVITKCHNFFIFSLLSLQGYPSSFPIEGGGTRNPANGQPCPGHRDTDIIEVVLIYSLVDRYNRSDFVFLEFHTYDFFSIVRRLPTDVGLRSPFHRIPRGAQL